MQFFASLTKTSALAVIYFNVCVFFLLVSFRLFLEMRSQHAYISLI